VATRFKPTRIVQGSWFEIQEWKVALIVEPLMIQARSALGAEVATHPFVQTLADKVIRLRPGHFNLEVLKNNGHRKGAPRLFLANCAMARPNVSGSSRDFVPDCAALAPARILALHLSYPPPKALRAYYDMPIFAASRNNHSRVFSRTLNGSSQQEKRMGGFAKARKRRWGGKGKSGEAESAVLAPISEEAEPEKAHDHHRPCGGLGDRLGNCGGV
jgi:hypothetical protein